MNHLHKKELGELRNDLSMVAAINKYVEKRLLLKLDLGCGCHCHGTPEIPKSESRTVHLMIHNSSPMMTFL